MCGITNWIVGDTNPADADVLTSGCSDDIVDRYDYLVEDVATQIQPLLRLPAEIGYCDLEHAGMDGLVNLAERVGDGPGFAELAKWAIRSAILDYVRAADRKPS